MTAWQYQFRDLTFGEGTAIDVAVTEGLEDLPALRTGDLPRSGRHGLHAGQDLAEGRSVVFELEVVCATDEDFRSTIDAIKAATTPGTSEEALAFQHPGSVPQQIFARPRRRAIPQDVPFSLFAARVVVEFAATDPRIYEATEQSVSVGFPTGGVGRTYDLTFDRVYGASGEGGVAVVSNEGTVEAPWQAEIVGPWVNPVIENLTTGDKLSLSISVGTGERLLLDSSDESVLLGTAHRLNAVLPGSVWPSITPGENSIRFGGASGTGSATITTRSAWL